MKWKPPRDYDKNKMLYPDRCMLKWQGFLLSDHNDRREEEEQQLEMEKMDDLILQCWLYQTPVQFNLRENSVDGIIQLIRTPWFYLKTETGTLRIHQNNLINLKVLQK